MPARKTRIPVKRKRAAAKKRAPAKKLGNAANKRAQRKTAMPRRQISDDAIIEAVWDSYGNITDAALATGMDRCAMSRRINKSELLKEARKAGTDRLVDQARSALQKKIKSGCTVSIIFALKTQGKGDGWQEDPRTVVNVPTDEERKNKLAEWKKKL